MTDKKCTALTIIAGIIWIGLLIALCIIFPCFLGVLFVAWIILLCFRKTDYFLLGLGIVPFLVWEITSPHSATTTTYTPLEQNAPCKTHPYKNGIEYEKYVFEKLAGEGYTRLQLTPASGDHGADILAITPYGQSAAIQCKFYKDKVGQHAVQEAVSARIYYNREIAIVITNSTFTPGAKDFAVKTETRLIERYL